MLNNAIAFCWAVDPSAVRSGLPSQFPGPVGAVMPCRLLSLPQPVAIAPVSKAAASAARTACTITDLAFSMIVLRRPPLRLGVGHRRNYASGVDGTRRNGE